MARWHIERLAYVWELARKWQIGYRDLSVRGVEVA
jgi:hypothetical protein